jgi:hypothetical protein
MRAPECLVKPGRGAGLLDNVLRRRPLAKVHESGGSVRLAPHRSVLPNRPVVTCLYFSTLGVYTLLVLMLYRTEKPLVPLVMVLPVTVQLLELLNWKTWAVTPIV